MKKLLFLIILIISSCDKNLSIPEAEKQPHELVLHGDTRIDNYYWMRLTDEQKLSRDPDDQTKDVLSYIKEEKEYIGSGLAHTNNFQEKIYNEIVGRIKKDDNTVPFLDNGYFYYSRFESEKEYSIHCRKKESLESSEEIILDENKLSKNYDYFDLGNFNVSPNNEWVAYSVDTLSEDFHYILQESENWRNTPRQCKHYWKYCLGR